MFVCLGFLHPTFYFIPFSPPYSLWPFFSFLIPQCWREYDSPIALHLSEYWETMSLFGYKMDKWKFESCSIDAYDMVTIALYYKLWIWYL